MSPGSVVIYVADPCLFGPMIVERTSQGYREVGGERRLVRTYTCAPFWMEPDPEEEGKMVRRLGRSERFLHHELELQDVWLKRTKVAAA